MRIYKVKDYKEMSRKAASIIAAQIIAKPDSVLGLATGSSPVGTYECLVEAYRQGYLDFSEITSVNLDEYKGLAPEDAQSYRYFMNSHLFDHVNIHKEKTFVPDGLAKDPEASCRAYDALIKKLGGADLQLLGLGPNGHIGFNEPDTVLIPGTHCVDLAESTIEANKRFFHSIDEVPRQAYSMGIQSIMSAKKILVVVSGKNKADALAKTIMGPIDPMVPASFLQLHHDVTIIADEDALSML